MGGVLHARLDSVDLDACDNETLVEVLADYERCAAQIAARQHAVLAAWDRENPPGADDWGREELAAAVHVAPETMRDRLPVSRTLTTRLAATYSRLAAGNLSPFHVTLLANAVESLSEAQTAAVEGYVLRADRPTYGEFRRRIRYALRKHARQTIEEKRRLAHDDRTAWHRPGVDDESGTLVVYGPWEATSMIWTITDDHAQRSAEHGDTRTLTQRRFDAFTDLFFDQRAWQQVRPQIDVTVPIETLLGGHEPGEIAGYGPILADTARTWALRDTARWRKVAYDTQTGYLASYDTQTHPPDLAHILAAPLDPVPQMETGYRPSPKLQRFLRAQYRTCVFPGCHRPARRCDVDHAIAWPTGVTDTANLRHLCRRHHRLKHRAGWGLTANPDGSTTWTTPTGHRYTVWPHDHRGP